MNSTCMQILFFLYWRKKYVAQSCESVFFFFFLIFSRNSIFTGNLKTQLCLSEKCPFYSTHIYHVMKNWYNLEKKSSKIHDTYLNGTTNKQIKTTKIIILKNTCLSCFIHIRSRYNPNNGSSSPIKKLRYNSILLTNDIT